MRSLGAPPITAVDPRSIQFFPTAKGKRLLARQSESELTARQVDREMALAREAYRGIEALLSASSGDRPSSAPLPVPDASAARTADVSAPEGRSSRSALAAVQPEHAVT